MIIIEGCDNTGKTTLADTLIRTFPQLHKGQRRQGPQKNKQLFMDDLWEILGSSFDDTALTVYDRLYFSELVYGKVLRGNVIVTPPEKKIIEELIKNRHQPLIIYCYLDAPAIRETFHEREQLSGVWENVEELVNEYNKVFMDWVDYQNFYIYDYRNPLSVAQVMRIAEAYVDHHVRRIPHWKEYSANSGI